MSLGRLPSREHRRPAWVERGVAREVKVCLFVPELLWLAVRRRAAAEGVSALHLVRVALEAFEPDWREGRLVGGLAVGELKRRGRVFPRRVSKAQLFSMRNAVGPSEDRDGVGLRLLDRNIGDVAAGASRGLSARARAIALWGSNASVPLLERELIAQQLRGQVSLFSARELIGV